MLVMITTSHVTGITATPEHGLREAVGEGLVGVREVLVLGGGSYDGGIFVQPQVAKGTWRRS
jgi:hypothetical protein